MTSSGGVRDGDLEGDRGDKLGDVVDRDHPLGVRCIRRAQYLDQEQQKKKERVNIRKSDKKEKNWIRKKYLHRRIQNPSQPPMQFPEFVLPQSILRCLFRFFQYKFAQLCKGHSCFSENRHYKQQNYK